MDSRKPFCELPDFEEKITLDDCDTYLDCLIPENDDEEELRPTRDDEYEEVYRAIMSGDVHAINQALHSLNFHEFPY